VVCRTTNPLENGVSETSDQKLPKDDFQGNTLTIPYDTPRSRLEKVPACNTKGNYHGVIHGH